MHIPIASWIMMTGLISECSLVVQLVSLFPTIKWHFICTGDASFDSLFKYIFLIYFILYFSGAWNRITIWNMALSWHESWYAWEGSSGFTRNTCLIKHKQHLKCFEQSELEGKPSQRRRHWSEQYELDGSSSGIVCKLMVGDKLRAQRKLKWYLLK
jgi:hypothetical protein